MQALVVVASAAEDGVATARPARVTAAAEAARTRREVSFMRPRFDVTGATSCTPRAYRHGIVMFDERRCAWLDRQRTEV